MTQIATPVESIPPTFNAAVDEILTHDGFSAAAEGTEAGDEFATINHTGVGRYIRNHWALRESSEDTPLYDNMQTLGYTHADDMSAAILQAAWCKHNNLEFDIESSVAEFKQYWDDAA